MRCNVWELAETLDLCTYGRMGLVSGFLSRESSHPSHVFLSLSLSLSLKCDMYVPIWLDLSVQRRTSNFTALQVSPPPGNGFLDVFGRQCLVWAGSSYLGAPVVTDDYGGWI